MWSPLILVAVLVIVSWVLASGRSHRPQTDPSREFALIALLLSIAFLVIPAVVALVFWLL